MTRYTKHKDSRLLACRSAPGDVGAELANFSSRDSSSTWRCAVIGDLHLAPDQLPELFVPARTQLNHHLTHGPSGSSAARVVQLGDLGHGKHHSGSHACFQYAREYLDGLSAPKALVLGNHDLEGAEFSSDQANLDAWSEVFEQPHAWHAWLGPALLVGLSTTRYRSNNNSHHEVYIDAAQLAWLEGMLQAHPHAPVVVFTHAPPMGCGLKVLQQIHVKNRCAWLNHSEDPHVFMRMLERYPGRVRAWFSGHFHLSHNYPNSVSTVGTTAFIQVGVIGNCNRDGTRQSRVLECDAQGFRVYTLDHDLPPTAPMRLDVVGSWYGREAARVVTPEEELVCDPSAGWLCSQLDCQVGKEVEGFVQWLPIGPSSMLALQDELLVEYDMATSAPFGLVCKAPEGTRVERLSLAARGQFVPASGPLSSHALSMDEEDERDAWGERASYAPSTSYDGSDVDVVRVTLPSGEVRDFPRNASGGFFQVFQPNKWRLKEAQRQREEQQAAARVQEVSQAPEGVAVTADSVLVSA